jgi:hypothetical protein
MLSKPTNRFLKHLGGVAGNGKMEVWFRIARTGRERG